MCSTIPGAIPPSIAMSTDKSGLLSLLPPELVINIYCQLTSLFDVLSCATSCRTLRQIWRTNFKTVYRVVAPRCVSCERAARALLESPDSVSVTGEMPSRLDDVLDIVKNAYTIELIISRFERHVVRKVNCGC